MKGFFKAWWKRGVLLGAATLLVVWALTFAIPLKGSSDACHLRAFYLPGLLAAGIGGHAGVGADLDRILQFASVVTVVFYALVGFILGASFKRVRSGAIACAVLLLLALAAAAAFDVLEGRSPEEAYASTSP
jgi:cation transport ATPase